MKPMFVAVPFIILGLIVTGECRADTEHAGVVKTVEGAAMIVRSGSPTAATVNAKVNMGDHVQTGSDGKIGMIFQDDTVVSMGPNSKIVIEDYLFEPAEKKLSFVTRMFKGTVSFLSGQITKLAPEGARVETPSATIGMRGTHVLVQVD